MASVDNNLLTEESLPLLRKFSLLSTLQIRKPILNKGNNPLNDATNFPAKLAQLVSDLAHLKLVTVPLRNVLKMVFIPPKSDYQQRVMDLLMDNLPNITTIYHCKG